MKKFNRSQIKHSVIAAIVAVLAITRFAAADSSVVVQLKDAQVELAAGPAGALRLSVSYDGKPAVHASTFLAETPVPSTDGQTIHDGDLVGIQTSAGSLLINPKDGQWTLRNAAGKTLIPLGPIGRFSQDQKSGKPEIEITVGRDPQQSPVFYGSGNGINALIHTRGKTQVENGIAAIPYYWSTTGYAAFAVTDDDNAPASWNADEKSDHLIWTCPGKSADLYLLPAADLHAAALAFGNLSGRPPVPPRWTFGYLQSRWGWEDWRYVDNTLKQFVDRRLPVDAFIFDFEWYTAQPDYTLKPEGATGFSDFGWNPKVFPDPTIQLAGLKSAGVHFVGIRKPRLGSDQLLAMMRAKHWDMQQGKGFDARVLDYQNPLARDWYTQQLQPLLTAGVDGWWDDEGELTYTTYYYWNKAEQDAQQKFKPGTRLWAIDRAFSPGVQRFGSAAWTGDIGSGWVELARVPTDLLNWSLAGMFYGACDIGGFKANASPQLLTRWIQAGVFFPVMRSHSTFSVLPRFPWLYGADAESAIRKALQLRYRLIPMYYSLAHEAHETGIPLMRPLVMEFPNDPKTANLTDQWLMGSRLMAAPVLTSDTHRSVYLPPDQWFRFNTSQSFTGGQTLQEPAALDQIPVFVRAGTIIPLGPVIDHTDQLPGGPLELQIYPGKNASFTFVEDDGNSTDYLVGKLRRTTFTWDDSSRKLSWKTEGSYTGRDLFTEMNIVLFDPTGKITATTMLGGDGNLTLPALPAASAP